tara:strand:+ start:497 stop:700 length:204 start_codon:yes stop_codon:yes gene_type:complete
MAPFGKKRTIAYKKGPFKMKSPLKDMSDTKKAKNLAKVPEKLRDADYYKKVKEVTRVDKVKSGGKLH